MARKERLFTFHMKETPDFQKTSFSISKVNFDLYYYFTVNSFKKFYHHNMATKIVCIWKVYLKQKGDSNRIIILHEV